MVKNFIAKLIAKWEKPPKTTVEEKFRLESELESSLAKERAQMIKERRAERFSEHIQKKEDIFKKSTLGSELSDDLIDLTEELDKLKNKEGSN
jgi:hypothetical protein